MTQAQKTAKAKFKQAIAYRQKTGVSLKEAFAHIYGKKKVGAVKKKSAPKKKVAKKKVAKKKVAKKVVKKKLTRVDYDKRYQAKKPGKRIAKKSGKTYYENRPNRSDKGKLLGIGNLNIRVIDDLKQANSKLMRMQNLLKLYQRDAKNPNNRDIKGTYMLDIAIIKNLIKEQKIHITQLKKNIK
jgi:hypothetical protein